MTFLRKPRFLLPLIGLGVAAAGLVAVLAFNGGAAEEPTESDEAANSYDSFVSMSSDVRFERTSLAAGEVPAVDHGILFVDPASGAGETWSVPDVSTLGELGIPLRYEVDRTHRWLRFQGA